MSTNRILGLIFSLLVVITGFGQNKYYVAETGLEGNSGTSKDSPKGSIGQVLSAVASFNIGDTIFVAAGTYIGTPKIEADNNIQNVVIKGDGIDQTIIEGSGTDQFLEFNGGDGNVVIQDMTIQNMNNTGGNGGAIQIANNATSDTLFLKNIKFHLCKTSYNGGAITMANWTSIELVIDGCHFDTCVASGIGGAIQTDYGVKIDIYNSKFSRNKSGGNGSAIDFNSATSTIVNSIFENNASGGNGDIYSNQDGGQVKIYHSNFVNNKNNGGASVYSEFGYGEIKNCIFYNNGGDDYVESNGEEQGFLFDHNFYQSVSFNISPTNSSTSDPQMYDPTNGDYRLKASSPAVDSAIDLSVNNDYEGYSRYGSGGNDIGAYETHCYTQIDTLKMKILDQLVCHNDSIGSVETEVVGGTGPFTFGWGKIKENVSLRYVTRAQGIIKDTLGNIDTHQVHVMVHDVFGCDWSHDTILVNPTQITTVMSIPDTLDCYGDSNAIVKITTANGDANYTYDWGTTLGGNDVITHSSMSDAADSILGKYDEYFVKVTDGSGCIVYDSIEVGQPSALTLSIQQNYDNQCIGDSSVWLRTVSDGGTAPYSIAWGSTQGGNQYGDTTNVFNEDTIKEVKVGSYYAQVTDAKGCIKQATKSVNYLYDVGFDSIGYTDSIKCYGAKASIWVNGEDGENQNSNFAYLNNSGDTLFHIQNHPDHIIDTVSNFSAGVYTVKVYNGYCFADTTITIPEPDQLTVSAVIDDSIACFGDSAQLVATVGGGITPYTIAWGTYNQGTDIKPQTSTSNLKDTIKYVMDSVYFTVEDANNCEIFDTVDVTQPSTLLANASVVKSLNCYGDTDGSLEVSYSGGTSPYSVDWGTTQGGNDIVDGSPKTELTDTVSNLIGNDYWFQVTDAKGCISYNTLPISEPNPFLLDLFKQVDTSNCYGESNASMALSLNESYANFTVLYARNASLTDTIKYVSTLSPSDNDTLTGLSADSVYIRIDNGYMCYIDTFLVIKGRSQLTASISIEDSIACYGDSTGKVKSQVAGGTAPYIYDWGTASSNYASIVSRTGKTKLMDSILYKRDSIHFRVTDALGCVATSDLDLTQPALFHVKRWDTVQTVRCQNGTDGVLAVELEGGYLPYRFMWSDTAYHAKELRDTTRNIVFDTITNRPSTNTFLKIVDAKGCERIGVKTMDNPGAYSVDLGPADTNICVGTSLAFNVGTHSLIEWPDGSANENYSVTPATGTYKYGVSVTNVLGCKVTDSITAYVHAYPVVNLGNDTTFCYGGTFSYDISTQPSILWSDGTNGISFSKVPTDTSIYWLEIGNGYCKTRDSITVNVNQNPNVNAGIDTFVCAGSTYTLDAGTHTTYAWENGPTTQTYVVSPSVKDTFIVTVGNGNCESKDSVIVDVKALPTVDLGVDLTKCYGENISLTTSTMPHVLWSDSTNGISFSSTASVDTLFWLEIGDVFQCKNRDTVNLTVNALPVIDLKDTSICDGANINLDAGSHTSYSWENGPLTQTYSVSPSVKDTFVVTVGNGNCSINDSIIVYVKEIPVKNIGVDQTTCEGDNAPFSALVAGASYNWNNGAATTHDYSPVITQDTMVSVVITKEGCTYKDTAYVTMQSAPVLDAGKDTSVCLFTDSLQLNGSFANAISVSWNVEKGSGNVLDNLAMNSKYGFDISDFAGDTVTLILEVPSEGVCAALQDTMHVTFDTLPVLSLGNDVTYCEGQEINFNISTIDHILWSDSTNGISFTDIPTDTTTYWLEIGDGNGCKNRDSITVNINKNPIVSIGADQTVCQNGMANFEADLDGLTYDWNNGASTSKNYTPLITRDSMIFVSVIENGCQGHDTALVTMQAAPILDAGIDTSICLFTDSILLYGSHSNASNVSWNADNGSGIFSNPADLNSKYTFAGSDFSLDTVLFVATVAAENACAELKDTMYLTFDSLPVLDLKEDTIVCVGTQLEYTINKYTNVQWSGDANAFSPTIMPVVSENQRYIATVTDEEGCISKDTADVTVTPIANLNAGMDTAVCANIDSFIMRGTATDAPSVLWETINGSGTFSDPTNLSAHYRMSASDKDSTKLWFRLKQSSIGGCPDVLDTVEVIINPLAVIQRTPDTSICLGDSIDLEIINVFDAYLLDTVASNEVRVSALKDTLIPISLTDSNSCKYADTFALTIDTLPALTFDGTFRMCFGDSVQIGVNEIYPIYSWVDTSANLRRWKVSPEQSKSYAVEVENGEGCKTKDTIEIVVDTLPVLSVNFAKPNMCLGDSVYVSVSGADSYNWYSIGETGSGVLIQDSLDVVISIEGQNSFGCIDSLDTLLAIKPLPVAVLTTDLIGGKACEIDTVTLSVTPGFEQYEFYVNDIVNLVQSGTNFVYTTDSLMDRDSMAVIVTDSNGCRALSNVQHFTIDQCVSGCPIMIAEFSYVVDGYTVLISDSALGNVTNYLYDWAGQSIDTLRNPSYTFDGPGFYEVCLTVKDSMLDTCSHTLCKSIEIIDTATTDKAVICDAKFSYSVSVDTVTLVDKSLGNYDRLNWRYQGTVFSTDSVYSKVVKNAGFHEFCLAVMDSASGCQSEKCQTIEVFSQSSDSDTVACRADFSAFIDVATKEVTFTNQSEGNVSRFYWQFGDGAVAFALNPKHTYGDFGHYNVRLVTMDSATQCQSEIIKTVSILDTTADVPCAANFQYYINMETLEVTFDNTSLGNYTGVNWNFGNGTYANVTDAIQSFDRAGMYNVTLTVFNIETGCHSSITKTVELVNASNSDSVVQAEFTFFPNYETKEIMLSNKSIGDVSRFYWRLSNGAISFDANPRISIADNGVYEVCLTVVNEVSGDQSEKCISVEYNDTTVSDSIFCNADFDFFTIIDSQSVSFRSLAEGNVSNVHWNFGDGSFSTEDSAVIHKYTTQGIYEVTMSVYDVATQCQSSVTKFVELMDSNAVACQANFTFMPNLEDKTISVTGSAIGSIDQFYWDFGNGQFAYGSDTTISYDDFGYYDICLTVYNEFTQCQSHICKRVGLVDSNAVACDANFDYFPIIDSVSVKFVNLSEGNHDKFYWSFGDGSFSNEENPIHKYDDFGYYGVKLTIKDDTSLCQSTILKPVELIDTNTVSCQAAFNFFPEDMRWVRCENTSEGTFTDFFWTFGDGRVSRDESPMYQYERPGVYVVTLNVFDQESGCHSVVSSTVEVIDTTQEYCQASFTYFADSTGEVVFTSTSEGTYSQWHWEFGDGNYSSLENPTNTYGQKGFYDVVLTVIDTANACIHSTKQSIVAGTDSASLTNCQAKFEHFVADSNVYFTNVSLGNYSEVYWSLGDGNSSSSLDSLTHAFAEFGYYEVTITILDSNTNCFDSYTETVHVIDTMWTDNHCSADFTYAAVGMHTDSSSRYDSTGVVKFYNMSFGNVTSFYWDFGDNSAASFGEHPSHPYEEDGYYNVCLTVYNDSGCVNTVCKVIAVGDVSNSCYAAYNYFVNDDLSTASFGNKSLGEGLSFDWDFGNDFTTGARNPRHIYDSAGYYNVCLTVTNNAGCESSVCKEVKIGESTREKCIGDCVLPGDANNDGEVNHYDLLPIGLYYGKDGPRRDSVSLLAIPHKSTPWSLDQPNGSNIMHADCNGDGIINFRDTIAIDSNFETSIGKLKRTRAAGKFELDFLLEDDPISGAPISIDVIAGDDITPLSMYGAGFEVGFPDGIDVNSATVDWSDTWLEEEGDELVIDEWGGDEDADAESDLISNDWTGDDDVESDDLWSDNWIEEDSSDFMMAVDYTLEDSNLLLVSGTRINQLMSSEVSPGDTLCRITFFIPYNYDTSAFTLSLYSNGVVGKGGEILDVGNESVVVEIKEPTEEFKYQDLKIFPNPTSGLVQFYLPLNDRFNLTVIDVSGRVVENKVIENIGLNKLNLNYLQSGIYTIKIDGEEHQYRSRIQISK